MEGIFAKEYYFFAVLAAFVFMSLEAPHAFLINLMVLIRLLCTFL